MNYSRHRVYFVRCDKKTSTKNERWWATKKQRSFSAFFLRTKWKYHFEFCMHQAAGKKMTAKRMRWTIHMFNSRNGWEEWEWERERESDSASEWNCKCLSEYYFLWFITSEHCLVISHESTKQNLWHILCKSSAAKKKDREKTRLILSSVWYEFSNRKHNVCLLTWSYLILSLHDDFSTAKLFSLLVFCVII